VGDAAGFTLNTGFTVRGMDLAAGSGIAAAKAIDAALQKGDFSQASLDAYKAELDRTFVGQDMNTYAKVPAFMENPRIYGDYGLMLSDVLYGIYNLDTSPRKHALPTAMAAFNQSPLKVVQVVKDILAALRGV
jgi:electron transfer flavoprotein-quinone oxidoreductase